MRWKLRGTGAVTALAVFLLVVMVAVAPLPAQQVTGELGAPSATTTIDGKQIPPPPKFAGLIKESAAESKPWWPAAYRPAQGRAECAAHHDR